MMLVLLLTLGLGHLVSGYTCSGGCVVADSYLNDGWCDCPEQCDDEDDWTCDTCPGCPDACADYIMCTGVETTGGPTDAPYTTPAPFTCNDDCIILEAYVNDDFCDCTECEDESDWNCDTCGGCAEDCFTTHNCLGTTEEPVSTGIPETTSTYTCDDGCVIDESYVNDDFCDCYECEDEDDWNCDSCGGCPAECGAYHTCQGPTDTPHPTHGSNYTCEDGCVIPSSFLNDDWCDCSVCEDEADWTCETCTGCPSVCGLGAPCVETTAAAETTEEVTTNSPVPHMCDDNCTIIVAQLNDGYCDCTDCSDEDNYDCATCGCPALCDDAAVQCEFDTTRDSAEALNWLLPAAFGLISALFSL